MNVRSTIHLLVVAWLVPVACAAADADATAEQVLSAANFQGGLIVHVGCGDGKLTAALRANDKCLVHGLDADARNVEAARQYIQSLGLSGEVAVEQWDGRRLSYADHLVNLIVVSGPLSVARDELLRVLRPGGVAVFLEYKDPNRKSEIVKPWPPEMDQWTHFLHSAAGNAVAADRCVAPATALQWITGPKYCRSHEIDSSLPAMVSANGRLFYILDEGPIGVTDPRFPARWALIARDAFNGVFLWKRPLQPWGWQQWKPEIAEADWRTLRGQRGRFPAEVPRRLVAVQDRVYVTLGFHDAPLSILDAATGETLTQCAGSEGTQEIVVDNNIVFLRVQPSGAAEAARRGKNVATRLLAVDATTGQVRWSQEVGNMRPLSLAADGDAVVFLQGPKLLCYAQQDGRLRWEAECPPSGILVIHKEVVLTTGKTGTNAFSLADGKHLWEGPSTGNDLLVIDDLVLARPGHHRYPAAAPGALADTLATGRCAVVRLRLPDGPTAPHHRHPERHVARASSALLPEQSHRPVHHLCQAGRRVPGSAR